MWGKTVLYLILLTAAPAVLSYAAHRLISAEFERGRETGRAYLRSKADALALRMRMERRLDLPEDGEKPKVLCAVKDPDGKWLGEPLPDDGRCRATASLQPEFPGHSITVTWPGERNPGFARAKKLRCAEISVYVICIASTLAAAFFLVRSAIHSKRELIRHLRKTKDFSHRLKTPITSISLCAELAASGMLDERRKLECAETVIAEAKKLDEIVTEVLRHIEGGGNG